MQQELFEEVEENASDLGSPISRGLVREALRLYPVAPFIGRLMPQNISLKGYPVEKDVSMPRFFYQVLCILIGVLICCFSDYGATITLYLWEE